MAACLPGTGRGAVPITIAFAVALLLVGCDALPRDPAGTSDRISRSKGFTVGFVDPTVAEAPEAKALVRGLEQRLGARAKPVAGSGEPLLEKLDVGTLDMAIGRFAKDSPWASEVALGPPLATTGPRDAPIMLRAAMRNGENRWIMTVERESRAASPEARAR